jgi:putative Mg2+ transporter-C (MgtC) family protein
MDTEVLLRLGVAALLGLVLGIERSLAGKHAGMRTYALVSLGSALFTLVGTIASYQMSYFAGVNPLQIAASVVIGIGFIGAGLSAVRDAKTSHAELTTAAGIWVAAGVGMASGYGLYAVALASTVLVVVIFSLFARLEHTLRVRFGRSPGKDE